jgi:hypothetical protein
VKRQNASKLPQRIESWPSIERNYNESARRSIGGLLLASASQSPHVQQPSRSPGKEERQGAPGRLNRRSTKSDVDTMASGSLCQGLVHSFKQRFKITECLL